ncbi:MAG TPA: PilX N-terminal domain-containing pilus assembly protein [Burkholderiales bacterium]|nr:PilX N-terminal domain-containing pilus assembly protein [Burkholderiales bacterium]
MSRRSTQRGATLIVALVILVLLALLALGAYNTSTTELRTAGNSQARAEALNAAQEAIETTISTANFTSDPANAITTPCGANMYCSDLNNDGTADYTTRLTPVPSCVSVKVIKTTELDFSAAEDLTCVTSQSQLFGVAGANTGGDSLCANTMWNVTAETTAAATGAKVTVSQGVGIRIGADETAASCL